MIANIRKINDYLNNIKEDFEKNEYTMTFAGGLAELDKLTLESLAEIRKIIKNPDFLASSIRKYTKEEFKNNPYIRDININKINTDKYELSKRRLLFKNGVHTYDEIYFDIEKCIIKPKLFTCENTLHCPVIGTKKNKDDKQIDVWMSVEPFEINSFNNFINEAKGNVLLLGLGLGYAAYMLSIKEDVNSITIIELDKNIIDIFYDNIYNQFSNKEKINIINDDAINYIENQDLNKYDYINLDIHKTVFDMINYYLKTLVIEKKNQDINFSYWLENELKTYIQRSIVRVATNLDSDEYSFDQISRFILDNENINSIEDFKNVLELKDFRNKMLNFYNNHKNFLVTDDTGVAALIKSYKFNL